MFMVVTALFDHYISVSWTEASQMLYCYQ